MTTLISNPFKKFTRYAFLLTSLLSVSFLTACEKEPKRDIFLKANPVVNAELERSPRSLRVFLAGKPDVSQSGLQLIGPRGEEELARFHTMGADDLMIEIKSRPLPDGEYTVKWQAVIDEDPETYSGEYQFTVKTKQ